jgi:diaminopimelate decarboxylase
LRARPASSLTRLNVGGGFPSRYASSRGPLMAEFFETIRSAVATAFDGNLPELECEPGRALCAPGVSLLTRVKLVRRSNGDLFLNDGIYGGLMEVSQAPDLMPFYRVIRDGACWTDGWPGVHGVSVRPAIRWTCCRTSCAFRQTSARMT